MSTSCSASGMAMPGRPATSPMQEAIKVGLDLKMRPTPKQMAPLAEPWRPLRGAAAHLWWSYYRVMKKREGVLAAAPAVVPGPRVAQAVTKSITARTAGRSTSRGAPEAEVRHADELLRRNADEIRIGRRDKAGQRRDAEALARRREHVALRRATHHHRALPRDRIAPAPQTFVRRAIGKADDAVPLPFVAPFRNQPPRGVIPRGVEAGAEATDLAPDQILLAAIPGRSTTSASRRRTLAG